MSISITPISDEMGASVTGITGAEAATPEVAGQIQAALDRYGVVVLPELNITDDDLAALARQLGDVVLPPHGALADHPEISPITRDPAQDKLAQYREANVNWHTDGTTSEVPDKLTMLTARRTADNGEGNTEFANTYAAYRALPDDDKALIDGLRVRHSFASAHRKIEPDPSEKQLAQWAMVPTREHPLVWKRKDGRRSLVMGSTAEAVLDMPDDEGQALLSRLLDWATQPQFTLSHSWREGDLVIFDNTGLLHRAMPYASDSPRLMHRATVAGDEAFA
jgi:alpha-ketoglutarate-dependent taurine dioxygenase